MLTSGATEAARDGGEDPPGAEINLSAMLHTFNIPGVPTTAVGGGADAAQAGDVTSPGFYLVRAKSSSCRSTLQRAGQSNKQRTVSSSLNSCMGLKPQKWKRPRHLLVLVEELRQQVRLVESEKQQLQQQLSSIVASRDDLLARIRSVTDKWRATVIENDALNNRVKVLEREALARGLERPTFWPDFGM
eukprot:gene1690-2034_t